MRGILEFFSLQYAVPLLLLVWLLRTVGARVVGNAAAPRLWAWGLAVAALLAYAFAAITLWKPTTPPDVLLMCVQATLAMGFVQGVALITLPVPRYLYVRLMGWRSKRLEQEQKRREDAERLQREAAQRQQAQQESAAAERRRQEEHVDEPPPPTREERMASAQERYQALLHMLAGAGLDPTETQAASARAKQRYLHEIEEIMK